MEWMTQEQFAEWLGFKEAAWAAHRKNCGAQQALEAVDRYQKMKEAVKECALHPVFLASDEQFDVQRAAQLVNDYEVELLTDLQVNAGACLVWARTHLELCTELGTLKSYEQEYGLHFSMLEPKGLIEVLKQTLVEPGKSGTGMPLITYGLTPRGLQVVQTALALAQKQIEEWEAVRGYPSLYQVAQEL